MTHFFIYRSQTLGRRNGHPIAEMALRGRSQFAPSRLKEKGDRLKSGRRMAKQRQRQRRVGSHACGY